MIVSFQQFLLLPTHWKFSVVSLLDGKTWKNDNISSIQDNGTETEQVHGKAGVPFSSLLVWTGSSAELRRKKAIRKWKFGQGRGRTCM